MALPPFAWRPATAADVPRLANLYADAARTLGPLVYTPAQVAAWAANPARDPDAFRDYVLRHDTWVADGVDGPLGFCGVDGGGEVREVHSLYVRADLTRQGLGSEMLRRTLARAEAADARCFEGWATPFSRPVFLRAGFAWTRTVVEPFAGVVFERYRLERSM